MTRRMHKLFASTVTVALIAGTAAVAKADVRMVPKSGCQMSTSRNYQQFYVAGGVWSGVYYASVVPDRFMCPAPTGENFIPTQVYLDFSLTTKTALYANMYRSSYDGTTVESRTLLNNASYAAGKYDLGFNVSFPNGTAWDYYEVSLTNFANLLGVGFVN